MKKLLYILPLMVLTLTSCQDYYLEHQLDYHTTIEDVRNFSYTLTSSDYSKIASYPENLKKALLLDEDDSIYYKALIKVGEQKYFTERITPDEYVPLLLQEKYPQLSKGTLCEITYRTVADLPDYLGTFKNILSYTFTTEPENVTAITNQLNTAVTNAKTNQLVIAYTSANSASVYQFDEVWRRYTPEDATVVAIPKSLYSTLDESYIAEPLKVLPIYLSSQFPYATNDSKYAVVFLVAEDVYNVLEYTYDDGWILTDPIADEVMSFMVKDSWVANISTYLSEPFLGHGQGAFVVQNVKLQDPLTYTWYYSATYGMCTSAYKDGASWESETWLVSPRVNLKKATRPQLVFEQAFNKAPNFTEECTVLVSTDYKDDVTTATWTALEWNLNEDGTPNVPPGTTWVFQSTGDMDLSAWAGQNITLGFRYTTSGGVSGTWEIRNLLVYEPED